MIKLLKIFLIGGIFISVSSCKCDYAEPQIYSVWKNMASEPIEEVMCAYPNQTISLKGCGFKTLKRLIVNSDDIDLKNISDYEKDSYITFSLPYDISTTGDYIRVVTDYGMYDYTFVVLPLSQQPVIYDFTPSFRAGEIAYIYGDHLEGAYKISVPLSLERNITLDCIYNSSDEEKGIKESVSFVWPEEVAPASGIYMIQMKKHDDRRGTDYFEKVYYTKI